MTRRLVLTALSLWVIPALAPAEEPPRPTVEHPVIVTLSPLQSQVSPGSRSSLLLQLNIPDGLWIGAAGGEVRSPGPTRLTVESDPALTFGRPLWPEPTVVGIPVRLGVTRIYTGRLKVVIPFEVRADSPAGKHRIVLYLTYTPGLNAGHLTPHVDERYTATVEVGPTAEPLLQAGEPEVSPAQDLRVERSTVTLPAPLNIMVVQLAEGTHLTRALHTVWEDPEHHGKSVQMVMHPYLASGKNNGSTVGGGMALLNATREGIGTGGIDVRAVHNEYAGAMGVMDVLSCPGAFHNYNLTAFYSGDRTRGARGHVENLTLAGGRLGYELQADAFQDGRFRYFGQGAGTREEDESAHTRREFGGALDLFWSFATNWRISVGGRGRKVTLDDPSSRLAREQPSTLARYPQTAGLGGGVIAAERVSLIFDRRNQEFTPSHGTFARVRAELVHNTNDFGTDLANRWGRFEALMRQYWSPPGRKVTLVISTRWEATTQSDGIPFWEQPSLGGADTLRGFDDGRFYGQHSAFASMEMRMQMVHMVMMGMPVDGEMAPFLDAGQVFDRRGFQGRFNLNPGLSMRILNRPNVGLVINWAYGHDGNRFTGGVSLPY